MFTVSEPVLAYGYATEMPIMDEPEEQVYWFKFDETYSLLLFLVCMLGGKTASEPTTTPLNFFLFNSRFMNFFLS